MHFSDTYNRYLYIFPKGEYSFCWIIWRMYNEKQGMLARMHRATNDVYFYTTFRSIPSEYELELRRLTQTRNTQWKFT